MTTLQKTLLAATLALAMAAVVYETQQNQELRKQNEVLRQSQAAFESASSNTGTSALQAQVDQLSRQNSELTARLAQAKATATQLDEAKQKAERVANIYRQLIAQADSKDGTSTNEFPTARHVFVGFGKLTRQMAELMHQDESKLSPDEKAASDAMKANLARDFMKLGALAEQFDPSKKAGANSANASASLNQVDNAADVMTCLLYGAMNLNEQQFADTFTILQKYQQQASDQNLFKEQLTPETESALKQLNEQARNEIQSLLSEEQTKTLEQISPAVQLVSRKFNITFNN